MCIGVDLFNIDVAVDFDTFGRNYPDASLPPELWPFFGYIGFFLTYKPLKIFKPFKCRKKMLKKTQKAKNKNMLTQII